MLYKLKACFVLMGFFYFYYYPAYCQDQKVADSLQIIYEADELQGEDKLELLKNLSFNELSDLDLALKYAEELIDLASLEDNQLYLQSGYLQKGNKKRLSGDFEEALEAYFNSAKIARNENYFLGEGTAGMCIADVYSEMGNSTNAVKYYNESIALLGKTDDSITLASALLNAGDEYFNSKKYDSALIYFSESGLIFEKSDYLIGTAYNLGNTGMVYAEQHQDRLAEKNINKAIEILEELQDYYPISVYLTYMSDIYGRQNDFDASFNYAKRSLDIARKHGLKKQISDANLKLAELCEDVGMLEDAYEYYKQYVIYRDSVKNIESVQQIADLRTNFEVSQKQIEVDLLNQQRKNQQIIIVASIVSLFLIGLLSLGLYHRSIFIQRTSKIIEAEKDRSESLLLNILPEETASELKKYGQIQAKKFDLVTVLFTDFKGFTRLAENVEPEKLVQSIDFYFKAFDEITTKYHLEKIKTIGDSYMCAGGLPTVTKTHARDVILAARDMIEVVENELKAKDSLIHFEIRIGVHTGPVIAGIVGIKKWQYDIWGDTVNIASRMESNSEVGRINISESCYNEIKDEFPCTYRGEIEVKNRGLLKMYFLS